MGSSFEVLHEYDLRRYFDSEKYDSHVETLGNEKKEIQEAICKSFIYGLSVNTSKITNIYEDEIDNIYDSNIGKYVISDFYTFNEFSKNDKAVKFFSDFLKDERFEKIDDVLYQIAEERFDWFTEQEKGLYGGKLYNMDASLSMSAPVSAKEELSYEDEEQYLPQKPVNNRLNQITTEFEEFLKDIRKFKLLIVEGSFVERYFINLSEKIILYRMKIETFIMKENSFTLTKDLRTLVDSFIYSLRLMLEYVEKYKLDFSNYEKKTMETKEEFSKGMDFRIKKLTESYLVISKKIRDVQDDDRKDRISKIIRYENQPANFERAYNASLSSSFKKERPSRTQLNNNFFNYFQTPGLKINFYGDAFDNKFLVNRVHYHRKNIETVISAYDGILND